MPNFNFNMFQRNAQKEQKKSFKDLSHEWKHDFTFGDLIPCLCFPVLPGDELSIRSQFFFQMDPLYYPIIHRLGFKCDYFYVRNANMWPSRDDDDGGWEGFISLKDQNLHPTVDVDMSHDSSNLSNNDSVYGYIGVPYILQDSDRTNVITGLNAFPAMAYLQIYDQYYRHPQLEDARSEFGILHEGDNTADLIIAFGYSTPTNTRLKVFPAKWGKDYFTSLLPTPQVGDPVQIPMMGADEIGPHIWKKVSDNTVAPDGDLLVSSFNELGDTTVNGTTPVYLDVQTPAATIRELSLKVVIQSLREMYMRFSNRYKDWLSSVHGEDIDPLNLQVPVMFGSYSGKVDVSTTMSQATGSWSEGGDGNYVGDYAANANLFEQGEGLRYRVPDYGIIMAIFTLTPNTGYGQGIPRWLRYADPFDYPMDIFQGVGDQEILKEEVMFNNVTAELAKNQETFGYGVRYQEAMTIPNNYGSNLGWLGGLSKHLGKWYDPEATVGASYDSLIEINRNFLLAHDAGGVTNVGGTRVRDVFRVLTEPGAGAPISTSNPVTGYILHEIGAMRPLAAFSTPKLGI